MKKILTIFERDDNFKIIDKPRPECYWVFNGSGWATEKLDGMNIRLTSRNGKVVRVEKRRNPTKLEKKIGILEPWYKDADEYNADDKYIFAAVKGTITVDWDDGEWSCEALGPKIQGNPLGLESHTCFPFSIREAIDGMRYYNITLSFQGIKEFFTDADSIYSPGHPPEGLVFHGPDGEMAKIKRKDYA